LPAVGWHWPAVGWHWPAVGWHWPAVGWHWPAVGWHWPAAASAAFVLAHGGRCGCAQVRRGGRGRLGVRERWQAVPHAQQESNPAAAAAATRLVGPLALTELWHRHVCSTCSIAAHSGRGRVRLCVCGGLCVGGGSEQGGASVVRASLSRGFRGCVLGQSGVHKARAQVWLRRRDDAQ
jgi:hypothetical protein